VSRGKKFEVRYFVPRQIAPRKPLRLSRRQKNSSKAKGNPDHCRCSEADGLKIFPQIFGKNKEIGHTPRWGDPHLPSNHSKMISKFCRQIKIFPELPSVCRRIGRLLSFGGHSAIINGGQQGRQAAVDIPTRGMTWQFGGPRQLHKAVQVQADIKAVHAQGRLKAVQAQSAIVAITKRMEMVAKKLARQAVGSGRWKKAAIEQAQLLDEMLDIAKVSGDDQLIAAIRKCHNAWGEGNPQHRAALDSGLTMSECLLMAMADRRPDQSESAYLVNRPVTTTGPVTKTTTASNMSGNGPPGSRERSVLSQKHTERFIEESAVWKRLGYCLVLPVIGFAMVAVLYTIGARKATSRAPAVESRTSVPEQPAAMPAPQSLAATLPMAGIAVPTPQLSTPTPSPIQTTLTPHQREQGTLSKSARNRHPGP
jgi:hypothetical protein